MGDKNTSSCDFCDCCHTNAVNDTAYTSGARDVAWDVVIVRNGSIAFRMVDLIGINQHL